MRYFIGVHIRGEAAEYYKATCADLAARFGVTNVAEIVPPYMTVRAPFERNSIDDIDNLISLVNAETPALPMTLSGWNHFGNKTIFIDVPAPSAELKAFAESFLGKLRGLGLPDQPQEKGLHFHMSVARFLKGNDFELIWKFLQSLPAPKFEIMFDNLTIFVKEGRDDKAWKILKTFPLTGKK